MTEPTASPGRRRTSSLFDRLDNEWRYLARSPATAAALDHWARHEPALVDLTDLHTLRATVHDPTDPARADAILAALARLGAIDGHNSRLAARVLLQLLTPGAARLARNLTPIIGDHDTAQTTVLTELAIGIRTFPWQRRHRAIAANLLLDTRQAITRRHRRHARETPTGLYPDQPAGTDPDAIIDRIHATLTINRLLVWARRQRILNHLEIALLIASHGHQIPMHQLAQRYGHPRSTLYAMRAAAHQRLRRVVSGTANATDRGGGDPQHQRAR